MPIFYWFFAASLPHVHSLGEMGSHNLPVHLPDTGAEPCNRESNAESQERTHVSVQPKRAGRKSSAFFLLRTFYPMPEANGLLLQPLQLNCLPHCYCIRECVGFCYRKCPWPGRCTLWTTCGTNPGAPRFLQSFAMNSWMLQRSPRFHSEKALARSLNEVSDKWPMEASTRSSTRGTRGFQTDTPAGNRILSETSHLQDHASDIVKFHAMFVAISVSPDCSGWLRLLKKTLWSIVILEGFSPVLLKRADLGEKVMKFAETFAS